MDISVLRAVEASPVNMQRDKGGGLRREAVPNVFSGESSGDGQISSQLREVAACCRMKSSAPTNGSRTILRRECAQMRGKCSLARGSPNEAPTGTTVCRASSVRTCCFGFRGEDQAATEGASEVRPHIGGSRSTLSAVVDHGQMRGSQGPQGSRK